MHVVDITDCVIPGMTELVILNQGADPKDDNLILCN
jgi:hypothetical protein